PRSRKNCHHRGRRHQLSTEPYRTVPAAFGHPPLLTPRTQEPPDRRRARPSCVSRQTSRRPGETTGRYPIPTAERRGWPPVSPGCCTGATSVQWACPIKLTALLRIEYSFW